MMSPEAMASIGTPIRVLRDPGATGAAFLVFAVQEARQRKLEAL